MGLFKRGEARAKMVRFDDITWDELRAVARVFDMTANQLVPLIMRNYMRHRWPLDLIPEPRPTGRPNAYKAPDAEPKA